MEFKIGCEIECYSKKKNNDKLRLLCSQTNFLESPDGSIGSYNYNTESPHEYKSPVYNGTDIKKLFEDVRKFFKLIKVNRTCGLHFHLSFTKMSDYYKLLNWKFVEQFQKEYDLNFIKPIEQQRKVNTYSKFYDNENNFNQDISVQITTKGRIHGSGYTSKPRERYHCINFNAFNHFKTVEFRIFPATNKITSFKKYVNFLTKNVDTFLKKSQKFKEIKIEHKPFKKPVDNGKIIIKEVITKAEIEQIKNQVNSGVTI